MSNLTNNTNSNITSSSLNGTYTDYFYAGTADYKLGTYLQDEYVQHNNSYNPAINEMMNNDDTK